MTEEQKVWLKLLEHWVDNDPKPQVSASKPKVQRITQLYGRPGNIIFCGKGKTIDHTLECVRNHRIICPGSDNNECCLNEDR